MGSDLGRRRRSRCRRKRKKRKREEGGGKNRREAWGHKEGKGRKGSGREKI